MLVHDLASLKVAVEQVAHDVVRLGHHLQELAFCNLCHLAMPFLRQLRALFPLLLEPGDALFVQLLQLLVVHQLIHIVLLLLLWLRGHLLGRLHLLHNSRGCDACTHVSPQSYAWSTCLQFHGTAYHTFL